MSGVERFDEPDEDLEPIPLIVVPHRESTLGRKLWPAFALLTVALLGLAYRASIADWQGVKFGTTGPLARAATSSRPVGDGPKADAKPVEPAKPTASPPVATESAEPAPTPKLDPWKEIEREAEKKKAERAELDKIKEEEAEKARHEPLRPVPPPIRRMPGGLANAEQHREMIRRFEQMRREHLAAQRRMFEQMARGGLAGPSFPEMMRQQERMMEQLQRMAGAPGLGQIPGLDDDAPPLPRGARPGVRTESRRMALPNGMIIIERRWTQGGEDGG